MNSITIDGRTLTFNVFNDITEFYEGTETRTYKEFGLFGKTITEEIPKYVFTIDEAITNPKITKEWWQKTLQEQINLLNRKEEIERGEFI